MLDEIFFFFWKYYLLNKGIQILTLVLCLSQCPKRIFLIIAALEKVYTYKYVIYLALDFQARSAFKNGSIVLMESKTVARSFY